MERLDRQDHAYVIGLDYGTDSVRALLADTANGREVDSEVAYYPRWKQGLYSDAALQQFRHHPKDYIECTEQVISALTSRNSGLTDRIVALALDSTASTPALTDRTGTPLALLPEFSEDPDAMFVLWKDHTGQREADAINATLHRMDKPYASLTGNHYSAECFWSKVLHLVGTNERVRAKAYSAIELCDFIPWLLSGQQSIEDVRMGHCVAGCKWMWSEDWGGYPEDSFLQALDPKLVELKGHLPKENFGCDHVAGKVNSEWANKLGLKEGTLIGVGNIDSHSGAVGGGVCNGTVVMNIGTSACYMCVMPKDEMGGRAIDGIFGQVEGSILPKMIGFEAGLSAMGDVYAWYKRLLSWPIEQLVGKSKLLPDETRRQLVEEAEERLLTELTEQAMQLHIDETSPLATDWFNGRRTPYPNNTLTASITQMDLSTSAPAIFYALAEATAFGTKRVIEHYVSNGIKIDRLIAIGGIAQKSPLVMQLIADSLGREIEVSNCKQAGAMGSVIHAATAAGLYPSVMAAQQAICAPTGRKYQPDAERGALLQKRYLRYLDIGIFSEKQQAKAYSLTE